MIRTKQELNYSMALKRYPPKRTLEGYFYALPATPHPPLPSGKPKCRNVKNVNDKNLPNFVCEI
jgi:hypothetical protein